MKICSKNFLTKYLVIAVLALGASPAFSQVSVSIEIAPPPLQEYDQPACPDDGYLWTPGYWAYGDNGYYWVPGAWVQPPEVGDFWTPPYWGSEGNGFVFYPGYWGPEVGYYGGIDYGYGYGGHGYRGGRWESGHFAYNTSVNNVRSANIRNKYEDRTAVSKSTSKVSYNGGKGGVQVQPTASERQSSNERRAKQTSGPQPQAAAQHPAQTQQKIEPQKEPAQTLQPDRQQQQPGPQQQESRVKQEIQPQPQAQTQPPVHEQQPQPKQETQPQKQTQAEPPAHEQQAQPKQEAQPQKQPQQSAPNKNSGGEADKKSNNASNNNGPGH